MVLRDQGGQIRAQSREMLLYNSTIHTAPCAFHPIALSWGSDPKRVTWRTSEPMETTDPAGGQASGHSNPLYSSELLSILKEFVWA